MGKLPKIYHQSSAGETISLRQWAMRF